MSKSARKDTRGWQERSRDVLADGLERVEKSLSDYAATLDANAPPHLALNGEDALAVTGAASDTVPEAKPANALDTICAAFSLSAWERDTLVLCAGVELSASFAALCAHINGDPHAAYATFGIALAALPGAHWDALRPEAPLRAWHLVGVSGLSAAPGIGSSGEGGGGASLTRSPLRADERIIHYLAGVGGSGSDDEGHAAFRLSAALLTVPPRTPTESQKRLAAETVALLSRPVGTAQSLPVPLLSGTDRDGCEAVAAHAAGQLSLTLYRLDAAEIVAWGADADTRLILLRRDAHLHPFALLLDGGEGGGENAASRLPALRRFVEQCGIPLFLTQSGDERLSVPRRTLVPVEVPRPTVAEQTALWQDALDSVNKASETAVGLAAQFSLSSAQITVAALQGETDPTRLWEACRLQARPGLDSLALRIDGRADWEDLVLPEMQKTLMHDILAHVRHRQTVHEDWGWARGSSRGLGLSALFAGTSGTGKTLAAEVIAGALRLDLYRVDLSQTISKYIGETEKNLGRIFDAAEVGSVILLFDEADALFGKRSEVQDSHDRYANIEVSYLLQRMEQYRGLAILTTNLKNSLDTAFLRRLRFVVNFPFPDAAQREAIWRRAFPCETPTKDLSFALLAQWSVAGGNIKSAALNAAFLAADENAPVGMRHLLRAAQIECAKLDRPLIEAETTGWVS